MGHEICMTVSGSNMKDYDFIVQKISYYLIILVNANGARSPLQLRTLYGPIWDTI